MFFTLISRNEPCCILPLSLVSFQGQLGCRSLRELRFPRTQQQLPHGKDACVRFSYVLISTNEPVPVVSSLVWVTNQALKMRNSKLKHLAVSWAALASCFHGREGHGPGPSSFLPCRSALVLAGCSPKPIQVLN